MRLNTYQCPVHVSSHGPAYLSFGQQLQVRSLPTVPGFHYLQSRLQHYPIERQFQAMPKMTLPIPLLRRVDRIDQVASVTFLNNEWVANDLTLPFTDSRSLRPVRGLAHVLISKPHGPRIWCDPSKMPSIMARSLELPQSSSGMVTRADTTTLQ